MLDRKEAKEIAQFVLKELRKTSYPYATDGRFDYRKTGMGRAKGGTIGQIGPEYQHYVCDVAWTSTGEDTIEWSAGSVKLADGRTQSLNSGGVTLEGTGLNYFWAVIGNSTIQTSTNYYDGVGDDKALLAFATKAPENDQLALVFPFFGTEPTFNSDVLSANMVLAAHIKAGVITASHIEVGSITADRLTFTPYIIGTNTLDDVVDGSLWGRVDITDITGGHIYLASTVQSVDARYVSDTEKGTWNAKNKVFRQTTAPITGMLTGDFWLDTDNGDKPYTYNGTSWIESYTEISGGHITTGTIDCSVVTIRSVSGSNKIEINANEIAGYAGAVKQFYIQASDGKAYAGGGSVVLDTNGITIKGAYLLFYEGATYRGIVGASSGIWSFQAVGTTSISLSSTNNFTISTGASGYLSMTAGTGVVINANRSESPTANDIFLAAYADLNVDVNDDIDMIAGDDIFFTAQVGEFDVTANTYIDLHAGTAIRAYGELRSSSSGSYDLGNSSYKWKNIFGTLILSTTYYSPEVEGMLCMAGGGSGDLYIYSSGAWRTNT